MNEFNINIWRPKMERNELVYIKYNNKVYGRQANRIESPPYPNTSQYPGFTSPCKCRQRKREKGGRGRETLTSWGERCAFQLPSGTKTLHFSKQSPWTTALVCMRVYVSVYVLWTAQWPGRAVRDYGGWFSQNPDPIRPSSAQKVLRERLQTGRESRRHSETHNRGRGESRN